LKYIIRLSLISIVIIGIANYLLSKWSLKVKKVESTVVTLAHSEPLAVFSRRLYKKGVISSPKLFSLLVKSKYNYSLFKAGKYLFDGSVSPQKVINSIVGGNVYKKVLFSFTIPEGFSLQKVNSRLQKEGYLLDAKLAMLQVLKKWNIKTNSLEGYLYPATYKFYDKKPSSFQIYDSMVSEFFKRLPKDFLSQVERSNLSLYKTIIIASMIEKETGIGAEKPLVAEVILNRIKKGIPLAIDATIIYGIKDYKGDLTYRHLSDKKNIYNTRVHKGLPPTPICSPTISSLQAVLSPSNYGYLFYVTLAGDKLKRHHFSKTLKEHNLYVRKLVEYSRKNK
jgi:UPF0755 protein